jgi:hypothetical protein
MKGKCERIYFEFLTQLHLHFDADVRSEFKRTQNLLINTN